MTKIRDQTLEDHQARREAAAYEVDKALGHLAGVVPVVYRKLNGQSGALLAFVDGVVTLEEARATVQRSAKAGADAKVIGLFDNVIGNLDRHEGNVLITTDKHLVPIDHGLAFPEKNANQGFMNFIFRQPVRLTPSDRVALEALEMQQTELTQTLVGILAEPGDKAQRKAAERSVKAMYDRVDRMLAEGSSSDWWRK